MLIFDTTISKVYINAANDVALAEFQMLITSDTIADVSSTHSGTISVLGCGAVDETDTAPIVAFVNDHFAADDAFVAYYEAHLAFTADMNAAQAIDLIPVVVTEDMVIGERKNRLAAGFDYDFGDARGVHHIGTTEKDLEGWREVTEIAQVHINSGAPNQTIDIATDTGPCSVTAAEWQSVLLAAAAFRQPIFAASFTLQATLPADYKTSSIWPA